MSKSSRLDEIFNNDWVEIHTRTQEEPNIECMHLTETGKQQIKDLMIELYSVALIKSKTFEEVGDKFRQKVNEL